MEAPRPGDDRRGDRPGGREQAAIEQQPEAIEPQAPQGWARKLLLVFPAALFIFLMAVLIWGILSDLLAGYR